MYVHTRTHDDHTHTDGLVMRRCWCKWMALRYLLIRCLVRDALYVLNHIIFTFMYYYYYHCVIGIIIIMIIIIGIIMMIVFKSFCCLIISIIIIVIIIIPTIIFFL